MDRMEDLFAAMNEAVKGKSGELLQQKFKVTFRYTIIIFVTGTNLLRLLQKSTQYFFSYCSIAIEKRQTVLFREVLCFMLERKRIH